MPSTLETVISYIPRIAIKRKLSDPTPLKAPEIEAFDAALLFLDVSGFTKLTEFLAKRGPDGAEEMTRALNGYFGQLIEIITAHGGDVVKFAGDAMLVIWPVSGGSEDLATLTKRAAQCALDMQTQVGTVEAVPGAFLSFKACIGAGQMAMAQVGGVFGRWEFVVMGEALTALDAPAHHCESGQVVSNKEAWLLIKDTATGKDIEESCVLVADIKRIEPKPDPILDLPPAIEDPLKGFLPGAVRTRINAGQTGWIGELRQLTVLFVNLPDLNHKTPLEKSQAIFNALQTCIYRYEGSINKLSVDEKGISLVAALGLPPLSHYDDPSRGVGAALAIKAKLADLGVRCSVGISTGRAFCGEVGNDRRREYTVMGDVVNLSARLMMTHKGEIQCDVETYAAAEKTYEFEALAAVQLKGKTGFFDIFRPKGKLKTRVASEVILVGRANERNALGDKLQGLRYRKEGGVTLIEGEAGMGKSSLMIYSASQAAALRIRSLMGAGDAVEQTTPYQAWKSIYAELFGFTPTDDLAARRDRVLKHLALISDDLVPQAPLLNGIVPIELADTELTSGLDGQVRGKLTNQLLVRLLQAVADQVPLMVVLDDAHWMDSASWALAQMVAQRVKPAILLIGSRPLPTPLPKEVVAVIDENALHLKLEPISPEESLTLACQRLGVTSLPEPVANLILERAAGHPLFIEELGFALRDSGHLIIQGDTCLIAPGAGDLTDLKLPNTVQGIITSRIDKLPPAEQLTLKVASVVGRTFGQTILADIHPIEEQRPFVSTHMDVLALQDLTILEDPETKYRQIFKSATTREVTYNLMLFSQRKGIHKKVAEWYEETYKEDLSPHYPFLAHHWSIADVPRKAVYYLEKAGELAEKSFAYREAASFFSDALIFDEKLKKSEPLRRVRLKQFLGKVMKGMGRQDEAQKHLEDALELARELGDERTEGQVLTSLGHLHSIRNNTEAALSVLSEAEAKTRKTGDDAERLRCLQFLARLQYRSGDPVKAIATSESALEMAKESTLALDTSVHLAFLGTLHVSADIPGKDAKTRMLEGVGFLEEAVDAARKSGNRVNLNDNLNMLGNAQWILGQFGKALETFEETRVITFEMGLKYDEICALINLTIQSHEVGDFAAMERHAHQSATEALSSQYNDYAVIALSLRSLAQAYLGKVADSARTHAETAAGLEALPEGAKLGIELTILPYEAERQLLIGQIETGLETAKLAWQRIEETGVREYEQRVLTLLGEAFFRNGDLVGASDRFKTALDLGLLIGAAGTVARARKGLAQIALRQLEVDFADSLLDEAHAAAVSIGTRFLAGDIAVLRGRAALVEGDRQAADRWFEEAAGLGLEAACPHLLALAYVGKSLALDGKEAIKYKNAAAKALDQQIAGLEGADLDRYLATLEREPLSALLASAAG